MKTPSIYVDYQTLESILADYNISSDDCLVIAKLCKSQSKIKSRRLQTINSADKKKVSKTIETDKSLVEEFNAILMQCRIAASHRGISLVSVSSFEYPMLCQVTDLAVKFSDDFKLPYRSGFKFYIQKGLEFMGKSYGLNKFKTYFNKIVGMAEYCEELDNDTNPEATATFTDVWKRAMHRIGARNYETLSVDKRAHLLRGRIEADRHKATYSDWVVAQFHGLQFTENVPNCSQYSGEGAINRYYDYINKGKNSPTESTKNYTGTSEAEKAYFALINKTDK